MFVGWSGVPTDRLGIYAGILVFLTIAMLGRGWAAWWQMMVDWLPFQAVLLAYDYSRGYASPYSDAQVHAKTYPITDVHNALGLPLHVHFPIAFDQWFGRLFGGDGEMPTTWVQEHFHPGTSIPLIGVLRQPGLLQPLPGDADRRGRALDPQPAALPDLDADGDRAGRRRRGDVLPLPDGAALAGRQRRGLPRARRSGATPPRAST